MEISELSTQTSRQVIINNKPHNIFLSNSFPVQKQDNYVIVDDYDKAIRFEGNFLPLKIEIEEKNVLSNGKYSSNYYRQVCIGRVIYNNTQIYETYNSTIDRVYRDIQDFRDVLPDHIDLLLGNEQYEDLVLGYGNKLYKIGSILTSEGCLLLCEYSDNPFYEYCKNELKVTLHDKKLDWFPL